MFIRDVAPAGLPVYGLAQYDEVLYSVLGNRLVELNPDTGVEISSMRLDFSGTYAEATRNSEYYFVIGRDNRLHALRADNMIQVYEIAAQSDTAVTSMVTDLTLRIKFFPKL